jgi:hypothetical protein
MSEMSDKLNDKIKDTCDQVMWGVMLLHIQNMHRAGSRVGLKKIPCGSPGCGDRRAHHERPDEPRGLQMCTVRANHVGPAYCSLNCYFYYKGTQKEKENETMD